jgi:hypothetical protein
VVTLRLRAFLERMRANADTRDKKNDGVVVDHDGLDFRFGGSPKNSSMDTPTALAMASTLSRVGSLSPFSHWETAAELTPTRRASSAFVRPSRLSRQRVMRSLILTLPY